MVDSKNNIQHMIYVDNDMYDRLYDLINCNPKIFGLLNQYESSISFEQENEFGALINYKLRNDLYLCVYNITIKKLALISQFLKNINVFTTKSIDEMINSTLNVVNHVYNNPEIFGSNVSFELHFILKGK